MSDVCGRCKEPFASWQKRNNEKTTATWRTKYCPDCHPKNGGVGRAETEMDCYQYIQARRVAARLRDAYQILLGHT